MIAQRRFAARDATPAIHLSSFRASAATPIDSVVDVQRRSRASVGGQRRGGGGGDVTPAVASIRCEQVSLSARQRPTRYIIVRRVANLLTTGV